MEDVFKLLEATEEGLTSAEVERRLGLFGPNKLESKEINPILQVCNRPWLIEASLTLSLTHVFFFSRACVVPFLHVEPTLMGHGGRGACRYCPF